jgi:hypothetical protein
MQDMLHLLLVAVFPHGTPQGEIKGERTETRERTERMAWVRRHLQDIVCCENRLFQQDPLDEIGVDGIAHDYRYLDD